MRAWEHSNGFFMLGNGSAMADIELKCLAHDCWLLTLTWGHDPRSCSRSEYELSLELELLLHFKSLREKGVNRHLRMKNIRLFGRMPAEVPHRYPPHSSSSQRVSESASQRHGYRAL